MTIESDIIAWALDRPGWQQDVMVSLANGERHGPERIAEIVDEILAGSKNGPTQAAQKITINSAVGEQVHLTAIAELQGVNALAEGQRLDFEPTGLTVIYGDNGSGKSGYARLIKTMVNARHRSEILPNVFQDPPNSPAGAMHYRVAGADRQLTFPSTPPVELLKMSFYDEHCGDEYLTKESTVSYRPSALTLLDELIHVCDDVRSEISARIKENESAALQLDLPSTTTAGAFVAKLAETTTQEQVHAATLLAPGVNARLAAVLQEEARLTASNPEREKSRLAGLAQQMRGLGDELSRLVSALNDERTNARLGLRDKALTARDVASIAAASSFDDEPLPGVGSETWRALWNAARNYSVTEAYPDHAFPSVHDDAFCILCQQSLKADAKIRLVRFERYMTDTTEHDAVAAEQAFATTLDDLRRLTFTTPARTASLRALEAIDRALADSAAALLSKLEEHRDAILDHLTTGAEAPHRLPDLDVLDQLIALADTLDGRSAGTDVKQFQQALATASAEKIELQASIRLSESRQQILAEVQRLKDLKALKGARATADTSGITHKASAWTREYATNRILEQFTTETNRLRLQKVTLRDLGGRKGQLNQKPGLLGATKGTTARSVLSEGEQVALGLAGFFTEAVFDQSKSAIVFDDPVTSLDHVRRDRVAERLAQLAQDRQVVVFTHDVAFTGDLAVAANGIGVPIAERAIERRGTDPGFCIPTFPWKAKEFSSRINHLTTELAKLKKDRTTLRQSEYEERVGSWAGYLSETWERSVTTEIMNQVFDRGTSQVRMMKFRMLAKITEEDNHDLQNGYGATSKWARRHDKSFETNYVAPEPDDLEAELTRIINWQKRVKKYVQ